MSETPEPAFDPDNMSVNQSPLQCFHYHSLGHRCGSPALRGEYFCYHHRDSLKPAPVIIFPTQPFELPRLTDRDPILRAADEIAYRIAANSIDLRRAKSVLSAIYLAAAHLPPAASTDAQPKTVPAEAIVEIEPLQPASALPAPPEEMEPARPPSQTGDTAPCLL